METTSLRVGLLGCGNVGGSLVRLLVDDADRIATRTGLRLELAAVAVRSRSRERDAPVAEGLLTSDASSVVADPTVDIVVEVIGGIEPARTLILTALKSGKPVVTANKELLANCGAELFEAASTAGVDLLFESAVAGGIPLIRPLRESLAGERIRRIMGIVNGTTNFILSRMSESSTGYHDALAEAQSLGYAERDPTADVEGYDAAAKAAILANVAFGARVVAGDVYREGISAITPADIATARRLGYAVKLLAVIDHVEADGVGGNDGDSVGVRVHPAMIPLTHPLATVRDSFNAVFVEGDAIGELMFLGRGAGGMPTASAVLGDLLDAAHNLTTGGAGRSVALRRTSIRPIDDLRAAYYLTLKVADRPGVLHAVSGVLGQHQVSIRLMEQDGLPGGTGGSGRADPANPPARGGEGSGARLVFVTHPAYERDVQACLHDLRRLDVVDGIGGLLRVVGQWAPGWRGVIEEYRARLPVSASTPVVTLQEGGTPLLPAPRLSERVGAQIWLKLEGANPTGSFKDRGMTVAISKAVEDGAKAVVCGSTGNTSASAAAYAARAGLTCVVLIPEGYIALGKLAQALIHGARVLQIRANFDVALDIVRQVSDTAPVTVVNSINPYRIEGQKTGAFEIVDVLGDAPDVHCIPVGNAGNITAYWKGYREYQDAGRVTKLPRMFGFQAVGSAPIVAGHPIEHPETIATAIRIGRPASWYGATAAASESGGGIAAVTDDEILAAYRYLAREESVFCEPASAASVAGLLKTGVPPGSTVVCVLTGHGLKDPDIAIGQIAVPTLVDADARAVRAELGL